MYLNDILLGGNLFQIGKCKYILYQLIDLLIIFYLICVVILSMILFKHLEFFLSN